MYRTKKTDNLKSLFNTQYAQWNNYKDCHKICASNKAISLLHDTRLELSSAETISEHMQSIISRHFGKKYGPQATSSFIFKFKLQTFSLK